MRRDYVEFTQNFITIVKKKKRLVRRLNAEG